jgi:hypothetical protein
MLHRGWAAFNAEWHNLVAEGTDGVENVESFDARGASCKLLKPQWRSILEKRSVSGPQVRRWSWILGREGGVEKVAASSCR